MYGILIFLTLNKHNRHEDFNYHSEIWADKAGYYVYLPATFKYGFDASKFPKSIDSNTGNGFLLNTETNTVQTKYTYGVSLMQLPFFLIAEISSVLTDQPSDGFSPINHLVINFAAISYFLLGLILLFHVLRNTYNNRVGIWVLASVFLGTNLYYYVVSATGMSHVYSFFLFSWFLYLLQKTNFLTQKTTKKNLFVFGLVSGLIILTRPSNIIFLVSFLFVFAQNMDTVKDRIKTILNPIILLPILVGVAVIFIPQFIYWKFAFGTWLRYSYQDEGFNWLSPYFLSVWFSPNNGLFLYGSLYLLVVAALFYSAFQNMVNWFYLVMFFGVSYITASWWIWDFGCSYGSRNFVEYLALFAIPLGSFYLYIGNKSNLAKAGIFIIGLAMVVLNFILVYAFDDCYFGEGNWDWNFYFNLITG